MSIAAETQVREELSKAGFRAEDLDQNRLGRIAPGQSAYSWASARTMRYVLGGIAVLAITAALLAQIASLLNSLPELVVPLLLLTGIPFAVGLTLIRRDLNAPLQHIEGMLSKRTEWEGRLHTRHSYVCVGQCFELPRHAFNHISAGGPCRVYYTPRFKFVVNVEILPGWQPAKVDSPD